MIYLVEDDHSIQKLVIYTLKSQGFEAEGFTLPSQFEKAMTKQLPSLIILDIMLPAPARWSHPWWTRSPKRRAPTRSAR